MNNFVWQLGCVLLLALAIGLYRSQWIAAKPMLLAVAIVSLIWLVLAVAYLFASIRSGLFVGQLSLAALPSIGLSLLIVIFFVGTLIAGFRYPLIHHISTDTENLPEFSLLAEQRGSDANPLDFSVAVKAQQLKHYPDIAGLQLGISPQQALSISLRIVEQLGWATVREEFSSENQSAIIEASATTGVFGFVDDVVIRILATTNGSVLDMRSISRVGQGDFGANAKRIRRFQSLFLQALDDSQ